MLIHPIAADDSVDGLFAQSLELLVDVRDIDHKYFVKRQLLLSQSNGLDGGARNRQPGVSHTAGGRAGVFQFALQSRMAFFHKALTLHSRAEDAPLKLFANRRLIGDGAGLLHQIFDYAQNHADKIF